MAICHVFQINFKNQYNYFGTTGLFNFLLRVNLREWSLVRVSPRGGHTSENSHCPNGFSRFSRTSLLKNESESSHTIRAIVSY